MYDFRCFEIDNCEIINSLTRQGSQFIILFLVLYLTVFAKSQDSQRITFIRKSIVKHGHPIDIVKPHVEVF